MIIKPETILVQFFKHLSQESRTYSVPNLDNSKYWAFKTVADTKKTYTATPTGTNQRSSQHILMLNVTSLILSTTI